MFSAGLRTAAPSLAGVSLAAVLLRSECGRRKAPACDGTLLSIRRDAHAANSCHAATYKENCRLLDLSAYNSVEVDVDRRIARAGASVTMEQLERACLERGFAPQVLPEFRGITVGGAVVGSSIESSSGRYGEFSETCEAVEVRLATGDVATLRNPDLEPPDTRADLFDALSGSYGSLCTVLRADVRLVPASSRVRLHYQRFPAGREGLSEAVDYLCEEAHRRQFAECLSYPNHHGHVVISGEFEEAGNDNGGEITPLDRPADPWFYEHVREARSGTSELVPAEAYAHRYERGAFWMARPEGEEVRGPFWRYPAACLLDVLSCRPDSWPEWAQPLVPDFRARLDAFWRTGFLYRALHAAPQAIIADNFLVTDIYVAPEKVPGLVALVRGGETGEAATRPFNLNTPIWLCPMRAPARPQPLSPHGQFGGERDAQGRPLVLIDVGLYGRVLDFRAAEAAQFLERWGLRNNSRKMHYSQNFYSEEQFWAAEQGGFSKPCYDELRRKYGADGRLVDLFTKVGNCSQSVEKSRSGIGYMAWSWLAWAT